MFFMDKKEKKEKKSVSKYFRPKEKFHGKKNE